MTNARFNASLPVGSVVVARDDLYSDNNGPYTLAYIWDGAVLRVENCANGYDGFGHTDIVVDATAEQIQAAAEFYQMNFNDTNKGTYIGCIVKLKRSRKAPNNVELHVVGSVASSYDNVYMRRIDAKIKVRIDENTYAWVNRSCIDEVVQTRWPFWAIR